LPQKRSSDKIEDDSSGIDRRNEFWMNTWYGIGRKTEAAYWSFDQIQHEQTLHAYELQLILHAQRKKNYLMHQVCPALERRLAQAPCTVEVRTVSGIMYSFYTSIFRETQED
jgi:hypothetical protein